MWSEIKRTYKRYLSIIKTTSIEYFGDVALPGRESVNETTNNGEPRNRGLAFLGANHPAPNKIWTTRPFPRILKNTDIIGRVHKTTICGTDLHILSGNVVMGTDPAERTEQQGSSSTSSSSSSSSAPATTNGGWFQWWQSFSNPSHTKSGNDTPRITLGHEGIVDIIEIGSDVKRFKVGDRILCCCIGSCGNCKPCRQKRYGNCTDAIDGSWSFGHTINGMQSNYVRVPYADNQCFKLPDSVKRGSPEEDRYLMLCDILPTSYEIGLVDGHMAPGKTMIMIGCGPVGVAGILCASAMYKSKRYPEKQNVIIAIDLEDERLRKAVAAGATHTVKIDKSKLSDGKSYVEACKEEVKAILNEAYNNQDKYNLITEEDEILLSEEEMLSKQGNSATKCETMLRSIPTEVDLVVEAVGLPSGWYLAQELVGPGGNIAILGVHGKPVQLNLETMWYRNFTLTAGMVHGYSIEHLMEKIESGDLKAEQLITHRFPLSEIQEAYDLFASRGDGVMKVLIENTE